MKKINYSLVVVSLFTLLASTASARTPVYQYSEPVISNITQTSARATLPSSVLNNLSQDDKQAIYFEYIQTNLACIAIYPTPEACLPKKTTLGQVDVTLAGLKANTSYTVTYKRDNSIRCITTPCPGNDFTSQSAVFTTNVEGTTNPPTTGVLTKNLYWGSRGDQVMLLQNILISQKYLKINPTGYFGLATVRAVMKFQRDYNIRTTGYVGPLTREKLNNISNIPQTVKFSGKITAYSTQCFVDGECSITVDGKKVITTTGWSQEIVGTVTGIPDFGSIEKYIGREAKVYASRVGDVYTLYGSANYYIKIK